MNFEKYKDFVRELTTNDSHMTPSLNEINNIYKKLFGHNNKYNTSYDIFFNCIIYTFYDKNIDIFTITIDGIIEKIMGEISKFKIRDQDIIKDGKLIDISGSFPEENKLSLEDNTINEIKEVTINNPDKLLVTNLIEYILYVNKNFGHVKDSIIDLYKILVPIKLKKINL